MAEATVRDLTSHTIGSVCFPTEHKPLLPELAAALAEFVAVGRYIGGPLVERFEEEVCREVGAAHAVGCKSGTQALQLALLACGTRPGDEVITVANTYYATAHAIRMIGAVPVFCDVKAEDGLIDVDGIDALVTTRTRAILPVHLYGMVSDMAGLRTAASRHGLALVEDCSHAFGSSSDGIRVGALSTFACFSLYPTKNLGAFGDAGLVLTSSAEAAEVMRRKRYFGSPGHDEFDPDALHANLDPLQACFLSVALRHFDVAAERRRRSASVYSRELAEWPVYPSPIIDPATVPYVFPLRLPSRESFIQFMRQRGVTLQVHYRVNLHKLREFGGAVRPAVLNHTERHNAEVVSLPVHPSLQDNDVNLIAKFTRDYLGSNTP